MVCVSMNSAMVVLSVDDGRAPWPARTANRTGPGRHIGHDPYLGGMTPRPWAVANDWDRVGSRSLRRTAVPGRPPATGWAPGAGGGWRRHGRPPSSGTAGAVPRPRRRTARRPAARAP